MLLQPARKQSAEGKESKKKKAVSSHPLLFAHLKGHAGQTFDARFSGNGDVLCSVSEDQTARVWFAYKESPQNPPYVFCGLPCFLHTPLSILFHCICVFSFYLDFVCLLNCTILPPSLADVLSFFLFCFVFLFCFCLSNASHSHSPTSHIRVNIEKNLDHATACWLSQDGVYLCCALGGSKKIQFYGLNFKKQLKTVQPLVSFETKHRAPIR